MRAEACSITFKREKVRDTLLRLLEAVMCDQLLDTKQAASLLGMSVAFLERDRWAGAKIPFVKIGERAVRYRRADLDAFIADRTRRSTSDLR